MESLDIKALSQSIQEESLFVDDLRKEIGKVIIGQEGMLDRLLLALLTQGHILLEGVPGLAKTLAIRSLAKAINTQFSRIQFTPDLLPADILGTMIYNQHKADFEVKKGPIFSNFVLADEINRAPAKVQSALLQAMQEKDITIGENHYKLEEPFLVMATQNPIDQEGTYPLPEAQVDRFMIKVKIDYPKYEEERQILRMNVNGAFPKINPVVNAEVILRARDLVQQVYMDEKIEQYILDIIFASREPKKYNLQDLEYLIEYGGSPRASISLAMASKAMAFLKKRAYVIPEDVREVVGDVLRHRIGVTYEAEAENIQSDQIIAEIINGVEIP